MTRLTEAQARKLGFIPGKQNKNLVKVPPAGMESDPIRPRTEIFIWEGRR